MPIEVQKNIVLTIISWTVLAIIILPTHYIFYFIDIDVAHLHIDLNFTVMSYPIQIYIHDLFLLYNEKEGVGLDAGWFVFLLSLKLIMLIEAYKELKTINALRLSVSLLDPDFNIKIYNRAYKLQFCYVAVWAWIVFNHLTAAGQLFHGLGVAFFIVATFCIFFLKRSDKWFKVEIDI